MADISKELETIKKAEYGRDVRGSIYNAINAVNSSAEGSAYAAEQSAQAAKDSETKAKDSETKAKDSETKAKDSETKAKDSETKAKDSETKAKDSETKAKDSETKAKDSETKAKDSETNAQKSELIARSFAVGGSGITERPNENTDNAKYYAEAAKAEAAKAQAIVGVGVMVGATDATDGVGGFVPAPMAGENNMFLAGDGTYKEVNMDIKANGRGISFKVIDGRPYLQYEYDDNTREIVYENGVPVMMANNTDIDNMIENIFDGDTTNDAPADPMIDMIIGEIFNN